MPVLAWDRLGDMPGVREALVRHVAATHDGVAGVRNKSTASRAFLDALQGTPLDVVLTSAAHAAEAMQEWAGKRGRELAARWEAFAAQVGALDAQCAADGCAPPHVVEPPPLPVPTRFAPPAAPPAPPPVATSPGVSAGRRKRGASSEGEEDRENTAPEAAAAAACCSDDSATDRADADADAADAPDAKRVCCSPPRADEPSATPPALVSIDDACAFAAAAGVTPAGAPAGGAARGGGEWRGAACHIRGRAGIRSRPGPFSVAPQARARHRDATCVRVRVRIRSDGH
jgi:hypothetical protein